MSTLTEPETLTGDWRDLDEPTQVRDWRTFRFMQMGVLQITAARQLADSNADLHDFEDLRERGWTADQAAAALR